MSSLAAWPPIRANSSKNSFSTTPPLCWGVWEILIGFQDPRVLGVLKTRGFLTINRVSTDHFIVVSTTHSAFGVELRCTLRFYIITESVYRSLTEVIWAYIICDLILLLLVTQCHLNLNGTLWIIDVVLMLVMKNMYFPIHVPFLAPYFTFSSFWQAGVHQVLFHPRQSRCP